QAGGRGIAAQGLRGGGAGRFVRDGGGQFARGVQATWHGGGGADQARERRDGGDRPHARRQCDPAGPAPGQSDRGGVERGHRRDVRGDGDPGGDGADHVVVAEGPGAVRHAGAGRRHGGERGRRAVVRALRPLTVGGPADTVIISPNTGKTKG